MNLFELGIKHNTDKSTYHGFTKVYDSKLHTLKEDIENFLEIGVLGGSSLSMWEEYFPKATIYGFDIQDKKRYEKNRIKIMVGNQESIADLEKLPDNLDIVLDDGGHSMKQQQISFKYIFSKKLKKGGIYIIEDLHTSLERYYNKGFGSNDRNNTLKFLKDLQSKKISENNDYFFSQTEFDEILTLIDTIEIFEVGEDSITSLIKKV